MDELDCDKDTAFESFIIKHHQMFNNEVDMYGDIQKAGDSKLKVRPFDLILTMCVTFRCWSLAFRSPSNSLRMMRR